MTPKARMLAAYRGEPLDRVPVAPEFWYYVPARLLGLDMIEFGRVPHWQALQETFRHYDCDGWGIVGPAWPPGPFKGESARTDLPDGRFEMRHVTHTSAGDFVSRSLHDPAEPAWQLERPIKDFAAHMPVWEQMTLRDPAACDWSPAQKALDAVGDDYLLEVMTGVLFTDWIGGPREGAFEQMIVDLIERADYLLGLRERFIEHQCALIEAAFANTTAEAVFIGCSWSCVSLLGARLWRQWDKPVLAALVDSAHRSGGLLHLHSHGKCAELVPDFVECGVDCVCPFERPPGGDVDGSNMAAVKDLTRGRLCLNGNVHTVETLIRGTPADVQREVREIIDLWADDGRLIVGTGDQVGFETPDDNIFAMIETARACGRTD